MYSSVEDQQCILLLELRNELVLAESGSGQCVQLGCSKGDHQMLELQVEQESIVA